MPRTKETKGRRFSQVMLTVLSAAIIAASVFIPAARAENPPMTVVYALDSANLTFRDSDAANINQINYAFALIRDGEAVGSHWAAIDRVRAYLRKHPHIRGVMAVGGWGAEGFSDACLLLLSFRPFGCGGVPKRAYYPNFQLRKRLPRRGY